MAKDLEKRLPAALAAVTGCASDVLSEAAGLQARLPTLKLTGELQGEVRSLAQSLDQEAAGAVGVLEELRSAAESGALNAAEVVRVLTEIDARMMNVLSRFGDVSALLEKAAESDEQLEPAYVFVVETAARLLQRFEVAQAATQTLRDAMVRRR